MLYEVRVLLPTWPTGIERIDGALRIACAETGTSAWCVSAVYAWGRTSHGRQLFMVPRSHRLHAPLMATADDPVVRRGIDADWTYRPRPGERPPGDERALPISPMQLPA